MAASEDPKPRHPCQKVVKVGDEAFTLRLSDEMLQDIDGEGNPRLPDLSDLAGRLPSGVRARKRAVWRVLEARKEHERLCGMLVKNAEAMRAGRVRGEEGLRTLAAGGRAWICVDCAFDSLMTSGELRSLRDQIARSYSLVRDARGRAGVPFVVCGVSPLLVPTLCRLDFSRWTMRFTSLPWHKLRLRSRTPPGEASTAAAPADDGLVDPLDAPDVRDGLLDASGSPAVLDPTRGADALEQCIRAWSGAESAGGGDDDGRSSRHKRLRDAAAAAEGAVVRPPRGGPPVYLTPDVQETLPAGDDDPWPECGTVIGGIVDRSRHTGAASAAAEEGGAVPLRLPLERFVAGAKAATRVLTTTAVVEIAAGRQRGVPWLELLGQALPSRKGKTFALVAAPRAGAKAETGAEAEDEAEDETQAANEAEGETEAAAAKKPKVCDDAEATAE